MTKEEFQYWTSITANSRYHWTLDEVRYRNTGELLIYKGGEDGIYVWVDCDGTARGGKYEGALPHIAEAIFHTQHSRQFADRDHAFTSLAEQLGVPFLRDMVCAAEAV